MRCFLSITTHVSTPQRSGFHSSLLKSGLVRRIHRIWVNAPEVSGLANRRPLRQPLPPQTLKGTHTTRDNAQCNEQGAETVGHCDRRPWGSRPRLGVQERGRRRRMATRRHCLPQKTALCSWGQEIKRIIEIVLISHNTNVIKPRIAEGNAI